MALLLYFVILVIFILAFACVWWYVTIPKNLPPGPLGLPFFGSTLDTWKASTMLQILHKWVKEYGPLYKLYIGPQLVVVLGNWEMLYEAMVKQGNSYVGRPDFANVLPSEFHNKEKVEKFGGTDELEVAFWKIQRKFTVSTLREFGVGRSILESRIKEEAQWLLKSISEQNGKPFDPSAIAAPAAINVICSLLFGKRFDYDDDILNRLSNYAIAVLRTSRMSYLTPFVLSKRMAKLGARLPQGRRHIKNHQNFITFIREETTRTLTNYHDGDEPNNYIEAFRKEQLNGGEDSWTFTDEQLISNAGKLFLGGTESSASTIAWALFYMAHYPDVQEKVHQEIRQVAGSQVFLDYAYRAKLPFTDATLLEVQRLADILPVSILRKTVAPSVIGGYTIPSGTIVVPLLSAILSDPGTYQNPGLFDPTRYLGEKKSVEKEDVHTHWVPFGLGKRVCLGAPLAKMEVFMFFTAMMSRYKFCFSPDEPKPPLDSAHVSLSRCPIPYKVCAKEREI